MLLAEEQSANQGTRAEVSRMFRWMYLGTPHPTRTPGRFN